MVKQIVTATENRIITGPKATTPLSEAKADSLIIDWRNHVDANAENGAKEYLKVLKYYSELWDEYGAGNIGDEKFRQYEGVMRTEVSRKMSGGKNQVTTVSPEKALKIAASGSLGMNWTKTAEEYGISAIKKYLEPSFKGKSRSEQGRIMVPYLSAFFKAVSNASPSVMQSLQSDNAEIRRKAAENLVLGTGVGKDKVLGVVDILDRWIDPSTGADIKPGVPFTNKNGVLVTPILKSPDGKIYFVETKKVKFQ
jgi:hypothetical protein